MQGAFTILVLLAVLVARGYVRSRPAGYQITCRDRVLVMLTVWAVGVIGLGAGATLAFRMTPQVDWLDRAMGMLAFLGIGLAPLVVYLIITCALRVTRYFENAYRGRHEFLQ